MSGPVWAVAKREYLQRVRTKWFVAATILIPVAMIALIVLPALFASRGNQSEREVVVFDRTGLLFAAAEEGLGEAGYSATAATSVTESELDSLRARVTRGDLGAVLILDDQTLARGQMTLIAEKQPSTIRALGMRQAVVRAALTTRLGGADAAEVGALLSGGDMEMDIVGGGAGFEDIAFAQAYIGAFFLYMTLLLYAVAVMRSVLEEKRDKVVEIVISSMRPFELMLGKILGVGAVGLTQLGIWIASAIVIFAAGLPALVAAQPQIFDGDLIRTLVPGMSYVGLLLIFFLGGYFIYSGLYAAVGAMCNTDEEAQQAQMPVIILLIVPIVMVTGVIQDPTSTTSVVLSYIPFFSPILMFARAVAGGAAWWEVAISAVLMAATVVAVAWVAGRIYKVGILMAGKRPTLPELFRWVRQA